MNDRVPNALHRSVVEIPSGSISYIDQGSGPPVILLHGAPMTSIGFVRVIQGLEAKYRVIAPDMPGFGMSVGANGFSYSLQDYSRFVAEFLDAIDVRDAILFVNDSSGCIGLHATPAIAARLRGVVVSDTVSLPIRGLATPVRWILSRVMGSAIMRQLNRRTNLLAWMVATLAPMWRPFNRDQRRAMTSQFDTGEKRDRILDVFKQMGRDADFMQAAAERAEQALRGKPALILFGQFDPMRFVGSIGRFKELFKQNQVAIIPLEEHFPILGSGGRIAAEIDRFITSLSKES